MRRLSAILAICAILVLPASLAAEKAVVEVHAGEHRDYTRLLMQLPEDVYWSLAAQGALARLEVDGLPIDFDLSQTFARIPRSRLHGIRQIENAIELTLLCDCEVIAYEDIPQFLVIDIRGSVSEGELAPTISLRPRPRPENSVADTFAPMRAGQALAKRLRQQDPSNTPLSSLALSAIVASHRPTEAALRSPASQPNLATTGHSEDEVANAIIAALRGSTALEHASDPASLAAHARNTDQPTDAAMASDLGAHVVISGLTDITSRKDLADTCGDPNALDISAWSDLHSNGRHAALLRDLTDEFGEIKTDQAIALAQSYFAIGFGAEGRMILSLISPAHAIPPELITISYLLDLENPPDKMPAGTENCGANGVLWAFLADPPEDRVRAGKLKQLVHAVKALPSRLRTQIAPSVISRLVTLGHLEQAHILQQAVGRVVARNESAIPVVRGVDAPGPGGEQAARLTRAQIIKMSDEDLLRHLPNSHLLAPDTRDALLERARLRQFELRHSAEGDTFAKQIVLAYAAAQDFPNAFAVLDGRDAALPEELRAELGRDLIAALVESAEDTDFVTIIFAQRPWDRTDLDATTGDAIMNRLAQLGFDEQARQMERAQRAAADPVNGELRATDTAPDISREISTAFNQPHDSASASPSHAMDAYDAQLTPLSIENTPGDALPEVASDIDAETNAVRAQNAVAALRAAEQRSETAGQGAEIENGAAAATANPEGDIHSLISEDVDPDIAILLQSERALEESAALRARIHGLINADQMP